jgi:hypothetical protein
MNIVAKILTLAGMLATVAWFFWNPSGWVFQWEPVVVFLFSLGGFVAAEWSGQYAGRKSQHDKLHPNDKQLFREFLGSLSSNGVIEFLRGHDFLMEFDIESVSPLRTFLREWDNANHEFQGKELEKLRKELYEAAADLSLKISKYTSPNQSRMQAVRSDKLKHIEEHEKRFENEAAILSEAADKVVRIHQDLVRKGRQLSNLAE